MTLAFVAAPVTTCAALAAVSLLEATTHAAHSSSMFFAMMFFGGVPLTVLFGVPAYTLLRQYDGWPLLGSMITGGLIANIPSVLFLLAGVQPYFKAGAQITAVVQALLSIVVFAAAGALGGLAFWWVAMGLRRQTPPSR